MNYEEIAREILDCCEGRPGGRLRLETAIAAALKAAERQGLEEAAKICFGAANGAARPDSQWMADHLGKLIRARAEERGEG